MTPPKPTSWLNTEVPKENVGMTIPPKPFKSEAIKAASAEARRDTAALREALTRLEQDAIASVQLAQKDAPTPLADMAASLKLLHCGDMSATEQMEFADTIEALDRAAGLALRALLLVEDWLDGLAGVADKPIIEFPIETLLSAITEARTAGVKPREG